MNCKRCGVDLGRELGDIKENPDSLMDSYTRVAWRYERGLVFPGLPVKPICYNCIDNGL